MVVVGEAGAEGSWRGGCVQRLRYGFGRWLRSTIGPCALPAVALIDESILGPADDALSQAGCDGRWDQAVAWPNESGDASVKEQNKTGARGQSRGRAGARLSRYHDDSLRHSLVPRAGVQRRAHRTDALLSRQQQQLGCSSLDRRSFIRAILEPAHNHLHAARGPASAERAWRLRAHAGPRAVDSPRHCSSIPVRGFPLAHCPPSAAAARRRVCWERLCLSNTHPLAAQCPVRLQPGRCVCARARAAAGGCGTPVFIEAGVDFSEPAAIRAPPRNSKHHMQTTLSHAHPPQFIAIIAQRPWDPRPLSSRLPQICILVLLLLLRSRPRSPLANVSR